MNGKSNEYPAYIPPTRAVAVDDAQKHGGILQGTLEIWDRAQREAARGVR